MKSGCIAIILLALLSCASRDKNTNGGKVGLLNFINGSYHLQGIYKKDSSGLWETSEWMKNGKGLLHYGEDGIMSVHFLPENYGKYPDLDSLDPYWYVASYRYLADSNIIYHTRLMHSDPDEVGKMVRRQLKFSGDTLTMFADEFNFKLIWLKNR